MQPLDWLAVIAGALFGGAMGSFLNVVMYRLPRNLSVSHPKRSFCPTCHQSIAIYDNIPVASFLWLGGRCRHCRETISLRYPVVEMLTVLLFLLVIDTFVIAGVRRGLDTLETDWPIVVAHLCLVAGLLATSGIDIEEYIVDVRITWLLVAIGCVAHVAWSSSIQASPVAPPGDEMAAAALAAFLGLGISRLIWPPPQEFSDEPPAAEPAPKPTPGRKNAADRESKAGRFVPVWLLAGVLVAAFALLWVDASLDRDPGSFVLRAGLIVGCCFACIVVASAVHRDSDDEIAAAIEDESPMARRMVLGELGYLAPAILLAVGAVALLRIAPVGDAWHRAAAWAPLHGLATALSGMLIAGALGWGVRIGFTLVLGREAFGLGDVHIMAAAGAVAGWFVVTIGFFLGSVFALAGVVCLLAVKRTRAIPYGPWLSIGIVVAMIAADPLFDWLRPGFEGLAQVLRGELPMPPVR